MDKRISGSKTVDDFYDVYDIANFALSIFGLSFLERDRHLKSGQYKFSWKRLLYCFLLCVAIFLVFYNQLMASAEEDNDNMVNYLLQLYLMAVGSAMSILMVVTALFMAPTLIAVLNNPDFFELFTIEDSFRFIKSNSLQQIMFALCVLIVCYTGDSIAAGLSSFAVAFQIFLFFFFPLYNSFCLSQFFTIHYWLQRLYWNINESLSQILKGDYTTQQEIFIFGIMEMKKSMPANRRRVCHINDFKESAENSDDTITAAEILRLRRIYHKTHKVAQLLNEAFSTRNILLLIHHCALETIYTYWAMRRILEQTDTPYMIIVNDFKAAFMSFVSVVSMVWPCTTTRVEAKRTVYLVQELLSKTKSGESRLELKIFALQLLQQKYSFSPYGFFEINNELILGFLGTMASYLVILLQYHMVNIALEANRNLQYLNHTSY